MNDNHIQQIFVHYINQFEMLNDAQHEEYYKWQIINQFHNKMDIALEASGEELPTKLYEMKKLSSNLIDSYTQPFHGLSKFAEKEPETVRQMFRMLYSDDRGDIEKRQMKVAEFLKQSHVLRDKYFPGSYLYKDDMHSVTGYLFLYDPDHNYIFKATHAQIFADCIEFYEDWGSGDDVKLDVYYRMCDQLVEAIKANKELMAMDASRFDAGFGDDKVALYKDPEKHILAFDLIYCCSTYGLFNGITFARPKSKERQLMQERKAKAMILSEKYQEAKRDLQVLEDAKEYVNSVYRVGNILHHKKYGDGVIKDNGGTFITVYFLEVGEKQLGTFIAVANGIITLDEPECTEKIAEYREILKKESLIKTAVSCAEKALTPYLEYLE